MDQRPTGDAQEPAHVQEPEQGATIMEGMLKKRGGGLPVMRDRYCVATWELDLALNKYVLLRSYKSRAAYDAHPERPTSVHQLKCISEWDGKTSFHRYEHAFTMETFDKKLFHCVAPSQDDKAKWVDLMAIHSAFTAVASAAPATSRTMRINSIGSLQPLRRASSVDSTATGSTRERALTNGSTSTAGGRRRGSTATGPPPMKPRGVSDVLSTDSEGTAGLGDDGLFRSDSTDSSGSLGNSRGPGWGNYGETLGSAAKRDAAASRASTTAAATTQAMVSKYDDVDEHQRQNVLLDQELLRGHADKASMASDAFLFDDAGGASRFGAVVVKPASEDGSDSADDLVDEELAARLEREKSEKSMRRRAKKLESNRDLYAEMAAARLKEMRKDARHPRKQTPRQHSQSRHQSAYFESDEDDYMTPNERSFAAESEDRERSLSDCDMFGWSPKQKSVPKDFRIDDDDDDDLVPAVPTKKEKKSKRKEKSNSISQEVAPSDDLAAHDDDLETPHQHLSESDEDDEPEEVVQEEVSHKKKSKKSRAKHVQLEEPAAVDDTPVEVTQSAPIEVGQDAAAVADEERKLAKQKRKEERRAKKERLRQKEEEEAAAAAAAELARQHLEVMRAREEEKRRVEQEKHDKKERREMKERIKLEKAKQRRAEAELLKLVEMKKAEEERREQEKRDKMDKKKVSKRRDKYTSPTERIHKIQERHAASGTSSTRSAASEVSNALVVVEDAPKPAAVASATVATPSVPAAQVEPETVPTPEPVQQVPKSAPVAVPSAAAPVPMAPQSMPAFGVAPPAYVPGYSSVMPPPNFPYVAYPHMPYPAPFAGNSVPAPSSYGVPIVPPYLQPHLGYVAGVPSMPTLPPTFPEAPPMQTVEEKPVMIGPQLPDGVAPLPSDAVVGPPPPPPSSTIPGLPVLPDLPDVVEF